MKISRRNLLGYIPVAAAVGSVPLLTARSRKPPRVLNGKPGELVAKGAPESFVTSTCGGCPGGCGIRGRVVGGHLVSISGNPMHPVNRGGLCPLGAAGAALVYHPDRLTGPMRRVGPRGSAKLTPVSWEAALAEVAARLSELSGRGAAQTVALVDGTRGLSHQVAARFMAAYGSPNHLSGRPWNDTEPTAALRLTQGVDAPAAYDLENAQFVLAFGSAWLEGSWSPVGAARAFGVARRGRKAGRLKVAQVEPRLSACGAHADEWIPILPGTEGILALGLMHMLLREGLEDRAFIDQWGAGLDPLRATVLRDYDPDAVSERTGVPVANIVRLARQLASARPAIAIGDDRTGPGAQSVETRMAIHALNALVGSINVPGGVLVAPPAPATPFPGPANEARPASPPELASWLRGGGDRPLNALIAYGADPLASLPHAEKAVALAQIPFVVSFSPFLDETAAAADIVLPDYTFLEKWQDDPCFTSRGFPVVGLRQPILAPRHDTRHSAEALAGLAAVMGGPMAGALPFKDFREVLRASAEGLFKAGRGAIFDVQEAGPWVELMEKGGWRASTFASFDAFWDQLVARGGWWDPVYDFGEKARVFRAAGGRFDFGPLAQAVAARTPDERQPAALPPSETPPPAGFPLRLHLYPLLAAYGDSQGPLPWVQDALGREMAQRWTLWVEIAPSDAKSLGVTEGSRITVESPAGAVEAVARIYQGVRPGVLAMPVGPGGAPGKECERALSAQAVELVISGRTSRPAGGEWTEASTWVRVRKV